MYAKPDTFDSEDNVACSFLNLQIMHVLQYSRCLHSIKHLTKPALVCLGMSVLTDCGVLNAIRHLVDADYRILRRVWYSNWQCGAAAIVSWKWVFHGNQKIRMPMICLKKVNEFVDGHSLKDDTKDNNDGSMNVFYQREEIYVEKSYYLWDWSFFIQIILKEYFILALKLINQAGAAWCCVLFSQVWFWSSAVKEEVTLCWIGKLLCWNEIAAGSTFLPLYFFNHEGQLVTLGNRKIRSSQK